MAQWKQIPNLLGQAQDRNNYPASPGNSFEAIHLALSLFSVIHQIVLQKCIIHFFAGLDLKQNCPRCFSALELQLPLSTLSARV